MGRRTDPTEAIGLRGEDKRRIVVDMFDRIAPRYDTLNHLVSLGQTGLWRSRALGMLDPPSGARVLDVGCGTGSVTRWMQQRRPDVTVEGMDPSAAMLERARELDPEATYFDGDAGNIDRPDGAFQAVTTCYTTRNFADLKPALVELLRVLEVGGTLLILDSFPPSNRFVGAAQRMWLGYVVPAIVAPFSDAEAYRYLARSIDAHVPAAQLGEMLRELGCDSVNVTALSFGAAHCIRAVRRS
jgi:demethylmenaquinone methyltransferase / 2-methoxy-6-polyprenyl-1,4-benzoquinol methylase